jgi:hypothetical protein
MSRDSPAATASRGEGEKKAEDRVFLNLSGGDLNEDNAVNAIDVAGFSACYGVSGNTMP